MDENDVNMKDVNTKLKQLKPCEFEWKSDNYDAVNQGFGEIDYTGIIAYMRKINKK